MSRLWLILAWIILVPPTVALLWFLEVEEVYDDFLSFLIFVDTIVLGVGSVLFFRFLSRPLRDAMRIFSQQEQSSPTVTTAQDVDAIRRHFQELTQVIQVAKNVASDCLAIGKVVRAAEKELGAQELEVFKKHDPLNKARNEARSQIKDLREVTERLIAGQVPPDAQFVALLQRILVAEGECRKCDGVQEDGECGAVAILSQIDIGNG